MTDQPPTKYERGSLEEAALRLGITVNAVRQRLKRGTLIGVKTTHCWLVDWRPTNNEDDSRSSTNQPTVMVGWSTTDHAAIEAIGVLRDLLAEERATPRQNILDTCLQSGMAHVTSAYPTIVRRSPNHEFRRTVSGSSRHELCSLRARLPGGFCHGRVHTCVKHLGSSAL